MYMTGNVGLRQGPRSWLSAADLQPGGFTLSTPYQRSSVRRLYDIGHFHNFRRAWNRVLQHSQGSADEPAIKLHPSFSAAAHWDPIGQAVAADLWTTRFDFTRHQRRSIPEFRRLFEQAWSNPEIYHSTHDCCVYVRSIP